MAGSPFGGSGGNVSAAAPGLLNSSSLGGFDLVGDAALPDVSFGLRVFITSVYALVCAAGLVGNGLVLHLLWTRKTRPAPAIDTFVFALAVADLQFSLTLPFWAVETALDFHWPFGRAACKVVPGLTVLSVYANAFLLTAMSVTRYWSVASALRDGVRVTPRLARWVTAALWVLAAGAAVPTVLHATEASVAGVRLCLFRFPRLYQLGLYHLQRVALAFLVPLAVISASYLLLLRLLRTHRVAGANRPTRQGRVAATVRLVVGSFFVCWFPNHALTLWGVLVKFGATPLSEAYYLFQGYVFPLTTCLAHSVSCCNPVLYCLMRREFRDALKDTFRRLSRMASSSYRGSGTPRGREEVAALAAPAGAGPSGVLSGPGSEEKEGSTLSTALELRSREPNLDPDPEVGPIPGVGRPL